MSSDGPPSTDSLQRDLDRIKRRLNNSVGFQVLLGILFIGSIFGLYSTLRSEIDRVLLVEQSTRRILVHSNTPVRAVRTGAYRVSNISPGPGQRFTTEVDLKAFIIDSDRVTYGDFCGVLECTKAHNELEVAQTDYLLAETYCTLLGMRLPTLSELDAAGFYELGEEDVACEGKSGFVSSHSNAVESGFGEWTSTSIEAPTGDLEYIVTKQRKTASERYCFQLTSKDESNGFRCAMDTDHEAIGG